jgi:hypothetical protein
MEYCVEELKARLREGMETRKQLWLADRTGFHVNQVQRYLAPGKTAPSVPFVASYCKALPLLNPAWVLLGDPEPKYRPREEEAPLSDQLVEWADKLKRRNL